LAVPRSTLVRTVDSNLPQSYNRWYVPLVTWPEA